MITITTLQTSRNTKQRELILTIVRSMKNHPTAEEVYEVARLTQPKVSLGTVYRNLNILTDQGHIREVQFEPGKARFDGMIEDHEHFICEWCKKIVDLEPTGHIPTLAMRNPIARTFTISSYKLTYYGVCKQCRDMGQ